MYIFFIPKAPSLFSEVIPFLIVSLHYFTSAYVLFSVIEHSSFLSMLSFVLSCLHINYVRHNNNNKKSLNLIIYRLRKLLMTWRTL